MSGGAFDYAQYRIADIYTEIEDEIYGHSISCCGIQASEVVLIVSIRTVESYVGKSTAGKNTGDQNWRNSYGTT